MKLALLGVLAMLGLGSCCGGAVYLYDPCPGHYYHCEPVHHHCPPTYYHCDPAPSCGPVIVHGHGCH